MKHVTFRLAPASTEMLRSRIDLVTDRLKGFFAGIEQAWVYVDVHPVTFAERLALPALQVPQDWRRPYLLEEHAYYQGLTGSMLAADTYLSLWVDNAVNLDILESTLPEQLQVPSVQRVPFPSFASGEYTEHTSYLAPAVPGDPYLAVLSAYEAHGTWLPIEHGLATNWTRLALLHFPFTLAIDIHTIPPVQLGRQLVQAGTRYARSNPDKLATVEYFQSVLGTEHVHDLRIVLLLRARRPDQFRDMQQAVQRALGRHVLLDLVPGMQAEFAAFFQPIAPRALRTRIPTINASSYGVGCQLPIALRRSVTQAGVRFGIDAHERVPVHYLLRGTDDQRGPHMMIAGATRTGKTVASLALALRHAVQGWQVVMFEPADTCQRLAHAIGDVASVALHRVHTMPVINVLDRMSASPLDQRDSIVRKLGIVLGRTKDDLGLGGRIVNVPYEFSNAALGALDAAMQDDCVYGLDCDKLADMTVRTAPLLSDLVAALRGHAKPEGMQLADDIENILLGATRHIYNAHMTLHFDPRTDVTLYAFQGVRPERLALLYDYLFDLIDAYVWSPTRNRTRPLLLFIDEFYYMASVPALRHRVIKAIKTWRNPGAGVVLIDQNAETFLPADRGTPGESLGSFATDNMRTRLFFQLEQGAQVIADAFKHKLAPAHVDQLRALGTGQCLAMLGRDVRMLNIDVTPLEARYLFG